MTEKIVIIIGATSGLGFETAKKVAKNSQDFHLIIPCHNLKKSIDILQMNLNSLKTVKQFVEEYKKKINKPIYTLICNAGINRFSSKEKEITPNGFDIIFSSNHLDHFLLTKLLLPLMDKNEKILSMSSDIHNPPIREGEKEFEWIGTDALAHPNNTFAVDSSRYAYFKLYNLYFIYELARKLKNEKSEIKVYAFNPDLMKTHLIEGQNNDFYEYVIINWPERYGDLNDSSSTLAELTYSDNIILSSGHFYDRSIRPCFTSPLSYKKENSKELWDKSKEYVKAFLN
ncbi:NAD(P)-binding protein [Neocallimastix lanati (nom. inval.)]|uniref:NAD(P)-binding protein n=1 Tax=Neocallimastix californiae TaxID=1754190 RepID=A0A1Y2ALL4_9FUNG|nr:NAD(P)-binding protein [Neocallimastix sp. JGI-2020a]ORY23396.1 NAD(P)-binding protein [Neocallimastix californiae]|eukprot:ORY23396.1 NAD(P)-binding protein [Neocallimastix californiae]